VVRYRPVRNYPRPLVVSLLVIVSSAPLVRGQSRVTALSVSAVVVPHCSVRSAAAVPDERLVSLSCSGHAARSVRAGLNGAQALPVARLIDANHLELRVPPTGSPDPLLTLDF
jgi:hypothetical protein